MIFRVKQDDKVIVYSGFELLQQLLGRVTNSEVKAIDALSETLAMFLQRSETMHRTAPFHLLHMGMMTGYYYAKLERNHEIEFEVTDEQDSDIDAQPSSQQGATPSSN